MNPRVQFIAVTATLLVAVLILELVRKRKLREEYSLLWLAAVVCLGILAFDRPIITTVSRILGVAYGPSALFIAAFAAGFLLLLHFSVAISRLIEREKILAQQLAILAHRLRKLETKSDGSEAPEPEQVGKP